MRQAIINTIVRVHRLVEYQNVQSIQDVDWNFATVIKTTGPVSLTDAGLAVIANETGFSEAEVSKQTYGRTTPFRIGGAIV